MPEGKQPLQPIGTRVTNMLEQKFEKPKTLEEFLALSELKLRDEQGIEAICQLLEEAVEENPKWARYLKEKEKKAQLSKNQRMILEILEQQPILNTKSIAELVFLKVVEHGSKEYSSTHRSLRSLEKRGLIKRVHGWQLQKTK